MVSGIRAYYHNTFGDYFDASLIWGPVFGRKIYAGIRNRIGQQKNVSRAGDAGFLTMEPDFFNSKLDIRASIL